MFTYLNHLLNLAQKSVGPPCTVVYAGHCTTLDRTLQLYSVHSPLCNAAGVIVEGASLVDQGKGLGYRSPHVTPFLCHFITIQEKCHINKKSV